MPLQRRHARAALSLVLGRSRLRDGCALVVLRAVGGVHESAGGAVLRRRGLKQPTRKERGGGGAGGNLNWPQKGAERGTVTTVISSERAGLGRTANWPLPLYSGAGGATAGAAGP